MTDALLAILTALLFTLQGVGFKLYGKTVGACGKTNNSLVNFAVFATGGVVACVLAFVQRGFDVTSLLYGLGSGAIYAVMLSSLNFALSRNDIAFVNFLLALAFFIPVVAGILFFDEQPSPLGIVGMAICVVAAVLVCLGQYRKNKASQSDNDDVVQTQPPQRRSSKIINTLVLIAVPVSNGALSVYIKFADRAYTAMNKPQFLLGTFLLATLVMLTLTLITTNGGRTLKQYVPNKAFFLITAAIGIVTVAGNYCFQSFSVTASPVVFYPITAAMPMLLSTLISPFFKEKLNALTLCGIVVGLCGVVLVNF